MRPFPNLIASARPSSGLFFADVLLYSCCFGGDVKADDQQLNGLWQRWQRRTTWRTVVVWAAFAVLVWVAHPSPGFFSIGLVLIALGECLRLWAAGHLQKNEALTTTGPYAYVKNPLYVGSLLIMLGFCLMARNYWLLAVGLVVFGVYYAPYKKRREGDRLRERFGQRWLDYDTAVPDYLPNLQPYPKRGQERWRSWLVIDNSEHSTAVAVVVGVLLVGMRWWLLPT
jgi:protein-S-isoprenylcysteine O-methyltransferase Ste14